MSPHTKKYIGRMLLTYGIPFLIMSGSIMYGYTDSRILFGAAVWMFVAGFVTRNWR